MRVSDLPAKAQQALGNRVRRVPMEALGFAVEPVEYFAELLEEKEVEEN